MTITDQSNFTCEPCIKGKMAQTINRESDERGTKPFEFIHCDLEGPMHHVSTEGYRYALLFVDDYTGIFTIYFLKAKSDTFAASEKFLADIASYGQVMKIRSDNGTEFTNEKFQDLLVKNKIRHETSAPKSPHQNGTAERGWRTIFESARAMLHESGISKVYWPYAALTAVHARNRCYNNRLKKTPYEAATGKKPDLSNLHIFGSTCYAYVHDRKKLDARARRAKFLGYDKYSPAYFVLFPETGEIKKARCVKFTDKFLKENMDDEGENSEEELQETDEQPHETQVQEEVNSRRYPERDRKPPQRLDDYVTVTVDYCYKTVMKIPQTYTEAMQSNEAEEWQQAMKREIEALQESKTFETTVLPDGEKITGGKWVFAMKETADGTKSYKARYVAKGYSQVEGVNYDEVFSPTAKMTSLRMIIQLAVEYNMTIEQMDVKSAYLNAPIEHSIFVQQPEGFETKKGKIPFVWKLKKSLYGLKQSGRNWNQTLDKTLTDMKFERSQVDPCVYMKRRKPGSLTILLIWVDDIIISSTDNECLKKTKEDLKKKFRMKDLGILNNFLGIEFKVKEDEIEMKQTKYLKKILERFDMENCKTRSTPCEQKLEFTEATDERRKPVKSNYREMIGSLIYAMTATRPDLCYVVTKLSQYLDKPTPECFLYVKHVLQYLKTTIDYGLHFRKSSDGLRVTGYSDSDWGCDKDRRSISGNCFTLNSHDGPLISWKSRKQATIALSSCEAEYMALSLAAQEALFLKQLLNEMDPRDHSVATLHCDNQGAIALSRNRVCNQRSKHIDIRYHFMRESVLAGLMKLTYVSTGDNFADMFTKPVGKNKLKFFSSFIFGCHFEEK